MENIQGKIRNLSDKKKMITSHGEDEKVYFDLIKDNGEVVPDLGLFKTKTNAEVFNMMQDGFYFKISYDMNGKYKNVKVIEPAKPVDPIKPDVKPAVKGNASVEVKLNGKKTGVEVYEAAKAAQEVFKTVWGKNPETDGEWRMCISIYMSLR